MIYKEEAKIVLERAGFQEVERFLFLKGDKTTGIRALLFNEKVLICQGDDSERVSYNELEEKLANCGSMYFPVLYASPECTSHSSKYPRQKK